MEGDWVVEGKSEGEAELAGPILSGMGCVAMIQLGVN